MGAGRTRAALEQAKKPAFDARIKRGSAGRHSFLAAVFIGHVVLLSGACSGSAFTATHGADSSGASGAAERGGGASLSGAQNNGGSAASDAGAGGAANSAGELSSGGNGGALSFGGSMAGGSSTGGEPSECPCAAPTPTCEANKCIARGPTMVKVDSFYVDATEVTSAHYALFQQAMGADVSGQAPECSWNDSFDPAFIQSATPAGPNEPITNVDYCDAAAFCAWANKRLCGNIGGGGLSPSELADPAKSQWFRACGGTAGQAYPYGAKYQAGYCNDSGSGVNALVNVAAKSECQGYVPGLFDMLGNAAEWAAACDGNSGPQDGCETIGGSYEESAACSQSSLVHRQEQLPTLGFRCCSR